MTLQTALGEAAAAGVLLVACDYDGTLAPIVDDPAQAVPDTAALATLTRIAALERTHAAILSGRGLDELRRLVGEAAGVALIGSHGAESAGRGEPVDVATREQLDEVEARFLDLARRFHGAHVEAKPAGVAFHYRTVPPALQRQAASRAEEIAADFPGLRLVGGKRVVELTAGGVDKGVALAALRTAVAADAVVFIGDDVTDEDAFSILGRADVAIKVGPGSTGAAFRIGGQHRVRGVLGDLLALRAAVVAPF